jgi:lipopolysaccharide transport system ATP-binding protein
MTDLISPNAGTITRENNSRAQLLTLNLGFLGKLSGYDNIILSLVTQGLTIKKAKALVSKIEEFAGISSIISHPVNTYSAGEKARLGFSISIQATPDILLLDEMMGVGDQEFKKKSSLELKKRVESEQTAVIVSHSTDTIKKFCERTLWLDQGTVKMLDETSKVLNAYNSKKQ